MSEEQERRAFEAWADDQGFPLRRVALGDDYQDLRTQGPWEAWQARALSAPAARLNAREAAEGVAIKPTPFAYWVYIPTEQRGEFVHDLDDACDDLTNCECKVTPLYAAPADASIAGRVGYVRQTPAGKVLQWTGPNGIEGIADGASLFLATPTEAPAACQHRIADARNPVVTSGYLCIDCGALFSAADHGDAPAAVSEPATSNEWQQGYEAGQRDARHDDHFARAMDDRHTSLYDPELVGERVGYMHHYRQIGGGAKYTELNHGDASDFQDAREGFEWYDSEPVYLATTQAPPVGAPK